MGEFVDVIGPDGQFQTFLTAPVRQNAPAVLVLSEIYNVNPWVRGVTDLFAQAGYLALAPDLFWRTEPGLYMDYTPENQQRGRKLAIDLDIDLAIRDIDLCMEFLRQDKRSNGKVCVMGYCLGGQLAYRSAARSSPDACAVYYGTRLQELVEEVGKIRCPSVLHFGELDHSVPVAAAHDIEARGNPNVSVHVYDNAPHGFGRFGYPPFQPGAAGLALERTLTLMQKTLEGG